MRLLITRPKEDAAALIDLLYKKGHSPLLFPLLDITFDQAGAKALSLYKENDIQALVVTSANGVRAFCEADQRRCFKVWAVGDASAKAAREFGFADVESASGDVETLAALIKKQGQADKGKLLHIAGSKVAGDLKGMLEADGFAYERVVLYHAQKIENLSPEVQKEIRNQKIDGVLLYSPRTAEAFDRLITKASLKNHVKNMVAYGLSEAVASKIRKTGFKEIVVADKPEQDSLLACLNDTKEKTMTDKKEENKKTDSKPAQDGAKETKETKVIEAKAQDVKIKETPEKKPAPKTVPKSKDAKQDKEGKPVSEDPVEKALNAKKEQAPKKKGSFKTKLMVATVVLAAGAGVGGYFTQNMWMPKVKAQIVETLKLEEVMQAKPFVSEEELTALRARLDELETRKAPTPEVFDAQPLLDKIAALESALASVQIANGDTEKLAEFEELAKRLEAAGTQDLDGLRAENERLSGVVESLTSRLENMELDRLAQRSAGDSVQALIASLSALRQTLQTSSSYASQLQTLSALATGDAVLEQAVATLTPSAEAGIPSFAALVTSFDGAANDIVRAIAIPEGTGWVEETVKNITSLVSIRRAPGHVDGEGPLGTVAKAEHNLRAGDLAGAINELKQLEGKPLEASSPWIATAENRLQAEQSLATIQAHILTLLNGAGGQG